ncbi:alpha/beta hydrolase [Streptomyces sp. NPDC003077]|uniref:alpha/beta hydrolase family protein n=1 Tax=Streptomyces sp. NPDC003077 TaxID=3154443 RepID=UPI0033BD2B65
MNRITHRSRAAALALTLAALPVAAAGTAWAAPAPTAAPQTTYTAHITQTAPTAPSSPTALTSPTTPASPAAQSAQTAQTAAVSADPRAAGLALPRPTGPFAVGRDTLHLVDRHRPDPWVPTAKVRELMVTTYFPARPGTGRPARYATTEEVRLMLEGTELDDIPAEKVSSTATHSREHARPLHGRYPLVVLSPGFSVSRYTVTALAEDIASRGYVVAAVDHAYESAGTAFPGGRMLTCLACDKVKTLEDIKYAAEGRAKDVSFVLDRLTGPNPAWPHAGLIDTKRIGMVGHSLGGASAVPAMATDRRITAGVNMDGTFGSPVPASGLNGRPFMLLGTDDETHRPGGEDKTWDEAWSRFDGWKRWLTVAGSDHFTFTDIPALSDQLDRPGPKPPLTGARSADITRAYVGAFFDQHLRRIPQPLLDGPSGANPEVKFHDPAPTSHR